MNTKNDQMRESNLKELLDEFKFHLIYRNKQTRVTKPLNDEFKEVLAQLREGNRVKRAKIRGLCEGSRQQKSATCVRPSTSLQSRIWQPPPINSGAIGEIKQNLIIVERQRDGLKAEISNLEASLVDLKKNVAEMRRKVELQSTKVQKYKHISYLSKSIQRNTDAVKILNSRSYKQMLKHQEQTLTSLKRFKTTLRKENEELQNKYTHNQQNSKSSGIRKTALSEKQETSQPTTLKIDRKFVLSLEELLHLFMEKEAEFEEIKVEQTTKIRLKKVQRQYLKEDRGRWHEMIERFEERHDVKMESLPNLILYIYKRLSRDCVEMENECIKRNDVKQLLEGDMHALNQKASSLDIQHTQQHATEDYRSHLKRETIFKNSQNLLKIVMLFHNLIGKFKYLFTIAITLSKEKKHFHDLLLQIGNLYNPNHLFLELLGAEMPHTEKGVANFQELESVLDSSSKYDSAGLKEQILSFVFSDLRYALVFHKGELEEQLKEGIQKDCIFDKIQDIQNRCDEVYYSKVKIYSHLLINCLKALSMNKYERKMVASSRAQDSIFMPIPKAIKIISLEEHSERDSISDKEYKLDENKFNSEESEVQPPNFEFNEDPRRIVQMLEQTKNEEGRKFRPLNLNSDQVYMYDRKVVIPKYIL